MSEQLRESMSAALDDEADAFELRRVIDEASIDDELRGEWHRMHLLRDFLRDGKMIYAPRLRDGVWEGLLSGDAEEEEAEPLQPILVGAPAQRARTWTGRITGVAVAALVAAMVVVGGGVFEDEGAGGVLDLATESRPQNLDSAIPVMYQEARDEDRQRQYGFVIHHIQQRAMNQAGVSSFAKMATFSQPSGEPSRQNEAAQRRAIDQDR